MSTVQGAVDLKRGRVRLAAAVVLGHAIKHVYNSGLRAIIMPEIKIGLEPKPESTEGHRWTGEDSGRGWVRELQGRWPGVLG